MEFDKRKTPPPAIKADDEAMKGYVMSDNDAIAQRELRAFINEWRERHDLRPSDVVCQLIGAIEHYKPTNPSRKD